MTVRTKGTELWLLDTTATPPEFIKIGCPTGISGLGGAKSQIETTCLDSDEQEFVAGVAQPGAITVNLDFDPQKISHAELWALSGSGDTRTWVIGFSDGTAPPTAAAGPVITYPTTRTYIEFTGYVSDMPLDFALNSVVKSAMQIQRSGARVLHVKTP